MAVTLESQTMNGTIAQLVALVCQGNAFLGGREIPDLLATNSSCQFCASITFDGAGSTRAANPNSWMESLREDGVYGFRLAVTQRAGPPPDRMTAGMVGGGGFWGIEAVKRDGSSDFYTSRWTVGDRDSPERRIWIVSYPRIATQKTVPYSGRPVAVMTVVLTGALNQIYEFAHKQRHCENFAELFAAATDCLGGKMAHVYHQDLFLPDTISAEAVNLLNACQAAWVFGGMGSWNDIWIENEADQGLYEALSTYLYHSLTEAIAVGANDSFRELSVARI